nr:immunoglobulin heavy chain junction region [Macaca mulatta]MOV39572.1 immunoglobulin heavy chain junction region [Macaca mulatta]MOV39634.1 immunoglobulin heavy chain junction region [Macaca mulatta]MOV39679.1 immunoglobulin heavy chain junction region [Macaca mulatta]MOV40368.1 immunoglobulin heavy chain junction region [Macaca mulatta]
CARGRGNPLDYW